MQRHFPVKGVSFEAGHTDWQDFAKRQLEFFDSAAGNFVQDFSLRLLGSAKHYPNIAALGFFVRDSQIRQLQQQYGRYRPRGLSFHLAPSNVANTAIFSWLCSLLAGNNAIIRLSSRLNAEQSHLMQVLSDLFSLPQHQKISQAVRFIRYSRNDALNRQFSEIADVRILWGGDQTIEQFSHYPTPPNCMELRFCERRSLAAIEAAYWQTLTLEIQAEYAKKLAMDILTFDQKACSSPTMLLWIGEDKAKQNFIDCLASAMEKVAHSVHEQFISEQLLAISGSVSHCQTFKGMSLHQLKHDSPKNLMIGQHGNIYWVQLDSLVESEFCIPVDTQTCVLIGSEGFRQDAYKNILADRYVNAGLALSFDWVWDGIDLIAANARKVRI